MPRFSDIMVNKNAENVAETKEFDTQTQAMDIPNEVFDGYLATGHCGFCSDPRHESGAA